MKKIAACFVISLLVGSVTPGSGWAESPSNPLMASLPSKAFPVSEYYYNGQSVYDRHDNAIGDVNDLLLDTSGKVIAVMVGVGGLLGAGEKNVAVPFDALKLAEKDRKHYLVLDVTKEELTLAPGYTFDRAKRRWVP